MRLFGQKSISKKSLDSDLVDKFVATNSTAIQLVSGAAKIVNCNEVGGQELAYKKCSALASVVNKKSNAIKNARFMIVDGNGKEIKGKQREFDRFMKPNPNQSIQDFFASIEFYKSIFGRAYVIKNDVGSLYDLYVVPNTLVHEFGVASRKNPFERNPGIDYYMIQIGNSQKKYAKEDVWIISDVVSSTQDATIGQSRLVSIEETINTFIASYEASTELLMNRGLLGVLSLYDDNMPSIATNAIPSSKADTKDVQDKLSKYGLLRNQFKYAVTNKRANFVQMSSNITDMGITEIQNQCKKDIAYTFQVPAILLDMAGGTYANVNEAKKDLYTDAIIPEALSIASEINRIHGFTGFQVLPYFDHLECFQNAKQQQAQGMTNFVNALNNAVAGGLMTTEQATAQLNDYLII